jgi:hypothetical protein
VILPHRPVLDDADLSRGAALPDGFRYASDTNDQWLSREDLQAMAELLPPARRAGDRGPAAMSAAQAGSSAERS